MMARLKHIRAPWAVGWLSFITILALFSSFIANDRPLIAHQDGQTVFPVLAKLADRWTGEGRSASTINNWYSAEPDWAIWPLISYDGSRSDLANGNYRSPLGPQETGNRARHWLGTDALGRDVAAGLVRGARVALLIGFGATFIALLIGTLLGSVAGLFGNTGWRGSRARWWSMGLGLVLGGTYAIICLLPFLQVNGLWPTVGVMALSITVFAIVLYLVLRAVPYFRRSVALPADTLVLQAVELFVNIPGLVVLIAVMALVPAPTIWTVLLVIGGLGWTRVVRFLRAELLRIRALPYIDAAFNSGISKWRILFTHALPNALGPLLVLLGFMVGGAILLEAFLSFLGLGLPNNEPTWGALLRRSREQPSAWWLAVFPGLFLTLTVLSIQVLAANIDKRE